MRIANVTVLYRITYYIFWRYSVTFFALLTECFEKKSGFWKFSNVIFLLHVGFLFFPTLFFFCTSVLKNFRCLFFFSRWF